jgi:hypothetical protein
MRGFSSGFPRRGAGVGLLVLRTAVGLQLLLETGAAGPAWWLRMLLVALALLLLLGALTPLAGAAAALHQLVSMVDAAQTPQLALAAMTALAVVLLGPGAYALDARLFGRRRLVLSAGPAAVDRGGRGRDGDDSF